MLDLYFQNKNYFNAAKMCEYSLTAPRAVFISTLHDVSESFKDWGGIVGRKTYGKILFSRD